MKNFNLTDVDHMYDQNNYTIIVFKLLCYKYKNDNFFIYRNKFHKLNCGYCSLEHIIPLILHEYNGIVLGLSKKCTVNDTAQLYIVWCNRNVWS